MILAILQARYSSSRLPGKVLKPILNQPMLWLQWQRLQQCQHINQLILATSTDKSDDGLAAFFLERKQTVFRGSLDNVLERFYQCALAYKPQHIVRLTGDCPVTDPQLIDALITQHLIEKNDYTSIADDFPDGLDAEIFNFKALAAAYENASKVSEHEHVTLYINQRPHLFKLGRLHSAENLSHHRWTVDNAEDFELIQCIYEALYAHNPEFRTQEILNLLQEHPYLTKLNCHIHRNEGLAKSLKNDTLFTKDYK